MRHRFRWQLAPAVFCVVAIALGACDRASEEECEEACLHYTKLGFAKEESVPLGSEAFDEAWDEVEETQELEEGLYHCVEMCQGMAGSSQTDCILEAESLDAADECAGVDRARTLDDEEEGGADEGEE